MSNIPETQSAAFEACKAWLADKKKIKTPTFGTYWCKHQVEEWAKPMLYVKEETFIAAALAMGFAVKNKQICMSRLSVRHLW
jgi:hypothetical protein